MRLTLEVGLKLKQLFLWIPQPQKIPAKCQQGLLWHKKAPPRCPVCSSSTWACSETPEILLLIPPSAAAADECLKGLIQNKITDFYHLPANSAEDREPPGFRAALDNGKWFNAPNELFLTVDTAQKGEMRRREKAQGGRGIHSVQEQEKVGFLWCKIKKQYGVRVSLQTTELLKWNKMENKHGPQ